MKKRQFPHSYVIVFFLIIITTILTWIIPAGEFNQITILTNEGQKTVIDATSYHHIEQHPQTWQVFSSIFDGIVDKIEIIAFIFIVGASFFLINQGKILDVAINKLLKITQGWQQKKIPLIGEGNHLIIIIFMVVFSIFGATFGMSEETIAFIVLFVPVFIALGYDSIVAVSVVFVGATIGFIGGVTNPFTVGIAQSIAGIPIFSGIEYRIFLWFLFTIIGIIFVLRYAKKVYKNPKLSLVYDSDEYWRNINVKDDEIISERADWRGWLTWILINLFMIYELIQIITINQMNTQAIILICLIIFNIIVGIYILIKYKKEIYALYLLAFTIIAMILGVLIWHWYIKEIATLFLVLGIFTGMSIKMKANDIAKTMIEGAKDIASAALIVGLASAIIVILQDGKILDTILYATANAIPENSKILAAQGMYIFETIFNFILPSGSAKAALTMPIIAPLCDILGISKQLGVLAYQLGDGFTNMITPVSGVLMGVLGIARIQYNVWVKYIWKFIIFLFIMGALLQIPPIIMELPGF
ncbi:MAG TPA: AbgT family transporter [Bacteroidales bacterium]|nr:AbgT family transporter [Bacteroidales bacterium]